MTLSLNFSSRQIFSRRLLESVSATLAKEGVDPSCIRIEITEDDIIDDYDSVRSMMDEYRRRGIGFLLDDFGSGYAGLTRYINLPFECVKLDRSFLLAAMSNRRSDTLMRALVGCFRLLDYDVVFEGIEDDGQLDYVRSCSVQASLGRPDSTRRPDRLESTHAKDEDNLHTGTVRRQRRDGGTPDT